MSKTIKTIIVSVASVFTIMLLCIFGVQNTQNKAFVLEEQVDVSYSDIKVQEKRRIDLVYNLADCVKEYDKHEYETIISVVEGRSSDGNIENVQTSIVAVSEAYPELKSNENYKQFMNELSITENLIAQHRSNYNREVKEYNKYIKKFPNRIFLNWLGYESKSYTYLDYDTSSDSPKDIFEK